MKFFTLFIIFLSTSSWAINRPYTDVVKELVPPKIKCSQTKENIYLSKAQKKEIEKISGVKLYGRLGLRYITKCPSQTLYHYIDSHIVRTLNETVIITVEKNKLASFTISSFNEPQEYKAPTKWLRQFIGKNPKQKLKLRVEVDALSGATLTAKASVDAVNKILAMHQVIKSKSKNVNENAKDKEISKEMK